MAKRNKWVPEDEPEENEETKDVSSVLDTYFRGVDEGIAVVSEINSNALDVIKALNQKSEYTPDPDAPMHAVSFALPRGVLVALLDSEHELADVAGATVLGLLSTAGLTTIGAIVRAGIVDETAIRHKMAAAWRAQHNTGIGGVNRVK